jgi:undecaprenyl-diphosphatase
MLQLMILAIVQGLTELLPISSTAHLLITNKLLNTNYTDNFSLTMLQLGTTVAIVLLNWDFLFKNFFSKEKAKLYFKIGISSLPVVIVGLILNDYVVSHFHSMYVIIASLIIVGIIMIIVENAGNLLKRTSLEEVSLKQSFTMGLAQTIALIPGVSRSGITTLGGIFAGINKYDALQFSFILGVPALVGSFVYEAYRTPDSLEIIMKPENILAVLVSGFVGYLSIIVLKKFSKEKFLTVFGIYRIVLGIILLITTFIVPGFLN